MASVMEIGSGLAIRISDMSELGSSANLSRSFLRFARSLPAPRRDLEFRSGRADLVGPAMCALSQRLAELGYEVAQSNAAWILDNYGKQSMCIGESGFCTDSERHLRAHALWWQASEHGNEHAALLIGDAYYYGREKLKSSRGSHYCKSGESKVASSGRRKTKIVCTIGPSTNTREMIWKLADAGMNVARLNMSHGNHTSHQKVIDLVKEYNAQAKDNVIAIMLDTKGPEVRSGDVVQPILLKEGEMFNFTIKRGVSLEDTVSVNYDDFIHDVEPGDILLVDGGMMSLAVRSKTADTVKCEVVDGGELKSTRHLNVRGKSATLPSITEKDWEDIKFGVDNKVDFYAVSFVKDANVVHQLKDYLKSCNADIHVIVKIESADSIPNLHSILSASDGAMVARGDLGAELPIEEVPLLQEDIINRCRSMQKPVIVATNMLESMIDHPTPTRAEASDISVAVREGADGIMLSGETAHGKYPLKAVNVMHTVASRTESTISGSITHPTLSSAVQAMYDGEVCQSHMSAMFASHSATMANILSTPIIVFTKTGSMAVRLSYCRPSSTIFAFTNEERVRQRLALYHGVLPIHMPFSGDAEETFSRAINHLMKGKFLKEGEYVTLVQSGTHSIWRQESTHHIQVRKVKV